ncbi:MAG: glycoside hydrolase family 127 protein [Limisphaerales bacterium]
MLIPVNLHLTPRSTLSRLPICAVLLALAPLLVAATSGPLVDTRTSPGAAVRPVALNEVRWTRGFWFDRTENLRTNLVPDMIRLMEGTNVSQYLENFRIAAGLSDRRPRGAPFNDGDFYKLIESASALLAVTHDARLAQFLESAIPVIASAQRPDGYLHTPVLARARLGDSDAVPFRDRNNFELYNLGHLMTAASVHHRVTGKADLLAVARKAADFLKDTLENGPPAAARSSVCPSHIMGLVELARVTGENRYLQLARMFFSLRTPNPTGGDDNQDRIPFEDQDHAMGHAVRANYLYAGATDLFLETRDPALWKPLGAIWTNVVRQKMYLTGGCGALYDGASPDGARNQGSITRVHQAYGRNYQLPNTTAHNETCASVGLILWNWRMFLATGEARYMDVLERALHNTVLAGVGLSGASYFYTNPLRVTDPMPADLRWSRIRRPYASSFCCPPNVLRTLAESATYAYATSSNAVWINLYGASELGTELNGRRIALRQETDSPWDGRVRIRWIEAPSEEFALRLRLPSWVGSEASNATPEVRVNDRALELSPDVSGYLEIRRAWRPGDTVDLVFPMPVLVIEANPLVEETLNQVALQRGPFVYCLESTDLPPDVSITSVAIPSGIDLLARKDENLLGGCVVLEGRGRVRRQTPWRGELYRPQGPTQESALAARFIPYAFWGNRGPGEMTVWFPLAWETPTVR